MVSLTTSLTFLAQAVPTDPGDPRMLLFEMLGALIIVVGLLGGGVYLVRRIFRGLHDPASEPREPTPRASDAPAFAAAAFQGVIKELREREKEQERLRLTERQRAEKSEQLVDILMNSMDTGLLLLDARGRITECNPGAKAMLGHQLLAGRGFGEIISPDSGEGQPLPRAFTGLEECLRTGISVRRLLMSYRAPNGRDMVLGVDFFPLRSAQGPVAGALCTLIDLTDCPPLAGS